MSPVVVDHSPDPHKHEWTWGEPIGLPGMFIDFCKGCGQRKGAFHKLSEAITIDLDGQSVEVATGYNGVGVFMTVIGARGNRIITVPLPRSKADELSRLIRLAAAASRFNDAKR